MAFLAVLVISASMVYDPTMKLLLYAMMPESYQTWPYFWACLTGELHFLVMFAAIATPTWQLQVISFELLNGNLQTILSQAQKR